MSPNTPVLTWLHIGDLHLTSAGQQNHEDFKRIVALASALPADAVDFILLPGDNANDGTRAQFALLHDALVPLKQPVHILPGDHDFATGSLDGFHQVLGARPLPYAETINGHRCLFLDVVSAGTGGPDFRLGRPPLDWCATQLAESAASRETAIVFMHTYPADLHEGAAELNDLLAAPHVACVDMGHTHYNELANDGSTVFMATRSTGQIEEGPPGFSVAAVDEGAVSWRFKEIEHAWPFVLVTHPVDRRLAVRDDAVDGAFTVRAKVLSDQPVTSVEASADGRSWKPMQPLASVQALWTTSFDEAAENVEVRARDRTGREDHDTIELRRRGMLLPTRAACGSDRNAIGAWPEHGIVGTQLGPNRSGRSW